VRRLVVLALLVLVPGALFWRPLFYGNFGVVDGGRVCRSAQPTAALTADIRRYGLKSVLNLRGGTEFDSWYRSEVRATHLQGVVFHDLPLSALRQPSRQELLELIAILDRGPYPMLIHCKQGSDRTGLACGLYLMLQRGTPPRDALSSFSIGHGHVPLGGAETLQIPFRQYDAWLDRHHLSHTPARFREWVSRVYAENRPEQPRPRPAQRSAERVALDRRASDR
jgi:protein tyrosine phosphatase (PTP) superfamily phosphohydrolase (DUF442 family)